MADLNKNYRYTNTEPTWSNQYLWPVLAKVVDGLQMKDKRIFEIGCGNGTTAHFLAEKGFEVTGIDSSVSGIELARSAFPDLNLQEGSAYDILEERYGTFPLVISLEVIEHCYAPRAFLRSFAALIEQGGVGILSTPYHGYWKNLALALAGKWDAHLTALWDDGHIKFFSEKTLGILLRECGFRDVEFIRVGRIPLLAKSLVAVVRKQQE